MTVKELKEVLKDILNDSLEVYIYTKSDSELHEIILVDTDLRDRVDINIE